AVPSLGLTSGILGAHRTGQGRDVDVSLFDVALHQLSYPATWYLNEQHVVQRVARSAHPATVPCQLYKTQDSFVFLMAMTDKF
ncbi:MAG: CoA transferase, partial [Paraglaciecola chathamensis]